MTTRGLKEADFVKVGEFIHRGVQLALEVQSKSGKKLADFLKALTDKEFSDKLAAMCTEVEDFAG
eukprot:scaffold21258_cov26-Tisochrysis_lutea.AAC.1